MKDSKVEYASYTYDHPNFLVRFPHRRRNKLVAEEIVKVCSEAWLDYGAGNGALLGELVKRKAIPQVCVLYEPDSFMYSQLINNLLQMKLDKLVTATENLPLIENKKYELITVLEVLEHLPLPERMKFYRFLANNLEKQGRVLIEVPIEYGPILLFKEWGRKFLKKRISEYSFKELLSAALFSKIFDTHSRYLINDERTFISPHRGFDLKKLIKELNSIGNLHQLVKSPFPFLPRMFNQVVLLIFELKERDVVKIEDAVIRSIQS